MTQKESCQICGKQFTRKHSVKVHMKVHENRKIQIYNTNEFAIQCQFCELGFSKQDILDRHIRVMHVRSINNGKHGNGQNHGQNNEKNIKKIAGMTPGKIAGKILGKIAGKIPEYSRKIAKIAKKEEKL